MWPFFNPTIKVVTFRLRGWCLLGVFFVAGIHPSRTWTSGSFESVRWNACVHRLDLGFFSHPKVFWGNGVWTHVNSKGKIPSTGKFPRGGSNPRRCGQRAQTLPTSYSGPQPLGWLKPGKGSTVKAGIEPRSATVEAAALPQDQRGGHQLGHLLAWAAHRSERPCGLCSRVLFVFCPHHLERWGHCWDFLFCMQSFSHRADGHIPIRVMVLVDEGYGGGGKGEIRS